jgi:molecular chaperone GrpE
MKFRKDKEKLSEENKIEDEKIENTKPETDEPVSDEKLLKDAVIDKEKINLEEKLKSAEQELENYKDRLLRKAAEFENYKRRVENDQLNLLKYAAESLIIKLLPVIDDFERSLVHIKDAKDVDSIKDGIKLVYDKLMKMLEDQGVKPIDAIGKPFDVHYHEAIMQRKVENAEPHTIIDEFEKGYMYKDRVIRHTKVAVSEDNHEEVSNPSEQTDEENLTNNESKAE